jgi:hypothetical protein
MSSGSPEPLLGQQACQTHVHSSIANAEVTKLLIATLLYTVLEVKLNNWHLKQRPAENV